MAIALQPKKLRVFCLHGYRQNKDVFREKSGAFRKLVKNSVEFHFVSAPHVIPEPENMDKPECLQGRGWWFSTPNRTYRALDKTDTCIGFEESLELVAEAFKTAGPFDGILGFSQGAAFASILCSQQAPDSLIRFNFAIFIAGFKSQLLQHKDAYSQCVTLPTFHTIGLGDAIIPSQSSEDLASCCIKPTVHRHAGGHYIPASPELKVTLSDFLSLM